MSLSLAACESSTGVGDELSSAEASALAAAILDLSLDASISETAPTALSTGPAATPVTFSHDVEVEGPCQLGGTMAVDLHVSGTRDAATQQGQLDIDTDADHRGCNCRFDLQFSGSVSGVTGVGTATLEGTACGV